MVLVQALADTLRRTPERYPGRSRDVEKSARDHPKYLIWLVQLGGFEPPTSGSTDRRSNQLSYSCP